MKKFAWPLSIERRKTHETRIASATQLQSERDEWKFKADTFQEALKKTSENNMALQAKLADVVDVIGDVVKIAPRARPSGAVTLDVKIERDVMDLLVTTPQKQPAIVQAALVLVAKKMHAWADAARKRALRKAQDKDGKVVPMPSRRKDDE